MSVAALRDGPLSLRRNEKTALLRRRSSRLRALNAITAALAHHVGLPASLQTDFTATDPSTHLTAHEASFLEQNDYSRGRRFQESSLPSISEQSLQHAFTSSDDASLTRQDAADTRSPAKPSTRSAGRTRPGLRADDASDNANDASPGKKGKDGTAAEGSRRTSHRQTRLDGFLRATPPRNQQADRADHQATADGPKGDHLEPASSPSSTAGAWSTATPGQAAPSSATSAEDDHAASNSDGAESRNVAQSSMDGADVKQDPETANAGGSDKADGTASPTAQLRQEQEQAARAHRSPDKARDATKKGQAAPASSSPLSSPVSIRGPGGQSKDADATTGASPDAARRGSSNAVAQSSESQSQRRHDDKARPQLSTGLPKDRRSSSSLAIPAATIKQPSGDYLQSFKVSQNDDESSELPVSAGYAALKDAADDPTRDYLEPLYRIQAQDPPNGRALGELLHKSSKAVTTADQLACVHEKQDYRILKRIYALQYANRWSLRQLQPFPEVAPPRTHMDYLLAEMKWMRTDFREERKIKKTLAKFLADECARWVNADQEGRQALTVTVRQVTDASPRKAGMPHSPAVTTGGDSGDAADRGEPAVPDLESSSQDQGQSPNDDHDMPQTPIHAFVPGSLFGAANIDESAAQLSDSDMFAKALTDLPLYAPFDDDTKQPDHSSIRAKPASVPAVSKFCSGKVIEKRSQARRKRSRFDYSDEDEDPRVAKRPRASEEGSGISPEQVDVALFDPANKHTRDRLHANTAFRPPSEFPMPSAQFYEFRHASQWTWEDDQRLRNLAKDYCFNWSLIADELALPSRLHNAADRRTPWECFERWVELETLPNEMRKTLYFKTWAQRMETASRNVDARYQAQLHHHAQNGGQGQPPMRRRTQPMRVERRRQTRYLHVIDAMRKLARKREQQAHKQAETQKAASLRKQHENAVPKTNTRTPQEFSQMRHERDVQMAIRQERYREHMLAQQKAAQMQRSGQAAGQQQVAGAPNAQQRPNGVNGTTPQQGQQPTQAQPGQVNGTGAQPNAAQQQQMAMAVRNGHLAVPQMGAQNGNVPQAQMQNMRAAAQAGQANMTAENLQRLQAQAQFKNAQMTPQQYQMAQQMLKQGQAVHGMMNGQPINNQALLQAMQAANMQGGMNGTGGNMQQGHGNNFQNAGTPHMPPPANPASQPQQLSSGHVPAINQIKHSLQAQHPQATPQQIDLMAAEHMRKQLQAAQARQNAMNAASGSHAVMNNNSNFNQSQGNFGQNASVSPNPHHANLVQQQQSQQNAFANASNSPQTAQYSAMMRQRLMQQQAQIQAQNSGGGSSSSPLLQQASPSMVHASPDMAHVVPNMNGQIRPPSRGGSGTPQMTRLPSNGSGTGNSGGPGSAGMGSPGLTQGSPRAGIVRH